MKKYLISLLIILLASFPVFGDQLGTGTQNPGAVAITGGTITGTDLSGSPANTWPTFNQSTSGTAGNLSGPADTSNTRKFLRELSVGGVFQAPAWDTIASGDLTTALLTPPAIGGTTPAAGSFSSLTDTGLTSGYLPYAAATTKLLTNSPIYTDGPTVQIGTPTASTSKLFVNGALGLRVNSTIYNNSYYSDNYYYILDGYASFIDTTGGMYRFYTAPSGIGGNVITPLLRFTLSNDGNVGIGTATFGTSAAKVLGLGTGTDPTTSPASMAQMWVANLNGANTGGFRIMNEAAATPYTVMGVGTAVAVSTGIATTLMGSTNIATNAGWLPVLNAFGVVVYIPYWTSATP